MKRRIGILLVALSMMIAGLACGDGGGDRLSGPEWDRYFGCLEIQEEWGASRAEAREICEDYRP